MQYSVARRKSFSIYAVFIFYCFLNSNFTFHFCTNFVSLRQWSFRQTGTMGTLAGQAEIGVWVRVPGSLLWGPGI